MARSFDAETPVLWYGPLAHGNPGRRNDRGWLLWPAWAYRVVAPAFDPRKINALQQAVLGILRASRLSAEELGMRLGVHPELAAFVVHELQTQGRINGDWAVTRRGAELLEEQRDASARMVPSWVFQDPWTGDLWPFVAPSLEYARTQPSERGYPMLDLGTTGKPWTQSAWLQRFPSGREVGGPGPHEIIRAAETSARLDRRARRLELDSPGEVEPLVLGHVEVERVARIEDEPTPVYLSTYLYVPQDDEAPNWQVCEPFGRGPSPALRRLVDRLSHDDQNLRGVLDRLLDHMIGESAATLRQAANARSVRARRILERALTIDVTALAVADPLIEMFEGWLELRELGDHGRRRRRSVLAGCRVALEQLFLDLSRDWPLAGLSSRFSREDREANAAQVRGAAASLGLDEPPSAMCNIRFGHLKSVAEYGDGGSLRALTVATLLCARDQPEHPLARAAAAAPDLLSQVDTVAGAAGAALHAGGETKLEMADLDELVSLCVEIVGHVHELPIRRLNEVMADG